MALVEQRRPFDCGVAALAMWLHVDYADVYAAAVQLVGRRLKRGLTLHELRQLAATFARPMTTVHFRRVDIEEDAGVLGVNWHGQSVGHWVVLRRGTIIDPSRAQVWDADEYLRVHQGRVGSLLTET